ncbi:MAG: HAMP domain-containing protein [Hamadaea sp.]|nr:HAMP domain-containing protein [Hamadaea sp.]
MNSLSRGSLRLRLTLAFSLIFLFGGAAVLFGSVILVRNSMSYALNGAIESKYDGSFRTPRMGEDQLDKEALYDQLEADQATKRIIIDSMQTNLIKKGGATVLGVWLVATATGWFLAGRVLRPLNTITAAAQRIAGRTLHRRIALRHPPGEVKTLADSFDSMLDRIDDAFSGQERFIANAAHELKTPIAMSRTLVEVAMRKRAAPPEIHGLGENLLEINLRHERLIESLLTLASAGHAITQPRPADLAELAQSAIAATDTQDAIIVSDLRPARTIGDPILLEQVIRNLVDNAVRYNVPGGQVEIRTRSFVHEVQVMVVNTGPVIAPHEVPTLFEPFRRLIDRVGSARGSGLGLSIVRAVAQAHKGDVSATPRPGGGLQVCVTLPAHSVR